MRSSISMERYSRRRRSSGVSSATCSIVTRSGRQTWRDWLAQSAKNLLNALAVRRNIRKQTLSRRNSRNFRGGVGEHDRRMNRCRLFAKGSIACDGISNAGTESCSSRGHSRRWRALLPRHLPCGVEVCATNLEVRDECFTGRSGAHTWVLKRRREWRMKCAAEFDLELHQSFAYGNEMSDAKMLEAVGTSGGGERVMESEARSAQTRLAHLQLE